MENADTSQSSLPAKQFKVLYAWQDDPAPHGDEQRLGDQAAALASPDMPAVPRTEAEIRAWLVSQLAEMLHIAPQELSMSEPFTRYGLDSADAIRAMRKVEVWLGRPLSPTLFWDYPTVDALTRYLAGEPETESRPVIAANPSLVNEPIAIIGMGCRFPGAQNPDEFWHLVSAGIDAISDVPNSRWDAEAF